MTPSGAPEHFFAGFLIAIFVIAISPRSIKTLGLALLVVTALGGGKEIFDYITNRWSLSSIDLLDDCVSDMGWDLIGGVVGIVFGAFARLRG